MVHLVFEVAGRAAYWAARQLKTRNGVLLDRRGLFIGSKVEAGTLTVVVSGHRVWSISHVPAMHTRFLPWPADLQARLRGQAACAVESSGGTLWEGRIRWDSQVDSPNLQDSEGRFLTVNKWGRLRAPLAGPGGVDRRPEVARATANVVDVLTRAGYPTFIVGGTLLGAIRDGEILPHDDDADVAYLSAFEHPSDIVAEARELEAALSHAGLVFIRHSWSHVQVLTQGIGGATDYYVDIFTAFFRDGVFHEPIHVRAAGLESAILPVTAVELHGLSFPAPADPEAWLEACYGADWRVPQPGFEFLTPMGTKRRFDSWFSSFNQHRLYWNDFHAEGEAFLESTVLRQYVAQSQEADKREIIDLGSGAGADLSWYEGCGWQVHPVDYSWFAATKEHPNFALVNLADYTAALPYSLDKLNEVRDRTGKPPLVVLNHLLGGLDGFGKPAVHRLIAFLVRHGARVLAADYSTLGAFEFSLPMTWHYPLEDRKHDASKVGLEAHLLATVPWQGSGGVEREVTIVEYGMSARADREA